MAFNVGTLEAVLRVREDWEKSFGRFKRDINILSSEVKDVGATITKSLTVPILAAAGASVKLATDFESSFADIKKTVKGVVDETGKLTEVGAQLSAGMRELSKTIPVNVNELNKLGGAAGQLQIPTANILEFTKTVAAMGVATNLSAEQAAVSFAKIANITGLPKDQFDRLGSSVVALGNNFATTESDIAEYTLRIAGAGKISGLAVSEITAIGAAMSSVGVEAEAGGTAIQKVLLGMAEAVANGGRDLQNFAAVAGQSAKDFAALWKTDAAEAFTQFVEGLQRSGDKSFKALEALGLTDQRLQRGFLSLAGAGDLLRRSIDLSTDAFETNNALANEAAQRYATFESQLTIVWNRVKDVGVTIGQALIPVLRDLLDILGPILDNVANLAKGFGELPKPLRLAIGGFVALLAAIGPVVFISGQLISTWGTLIAVAPRMAAAVTLATGPWGLIAAAIAAATLALTTFLALWKERMQREMGEMIDQANQLGDAWDRLHTIRERGGVSSAAEVARLDQEFLEVSDQLLVKQQELADFLRTRGKQSVDQLGQAERNLAGDLIESTQRLEARKQVIIDSLSSITNFSDLTEDASESTATLGGALNLTTKEGDKLAARLKSLRADLARNADQNRELAASFGRVGQIERTETERRIEAIKRSHALHNAYLADVEEFGKDAAESLKSLRAADFDAAKGAEDAQAAYDALQAALKDLDDQVRRLATSVKAVDTSKLEADSKKIAQVTRDLRDLKLDADFAIRITGIEEATPALEEIERQWLEMLRSFGGGSVSAGEEIFNALAERLGVTIDEIKSHLQSLQDADTLASIRGSGQSSRARFDQDIAEWRRLMAEYPSRTADIQAQINLTTERFWNEQLGAWSDALGFLANQFGGFFNYLDQAAQALQQAQGFGQSISDISSGFGASGSTASALGTIGTVFAIWAAVYEGVDKIIKSKKSRRFASPAEFGIDDGQAHSFSVTTQGLELANAIRDTIRELESALGFSIESLATIGIQIRNDGNRFRALIEGELVGVFGSLEDAIGAALAVALQRTDTIISGISDLMREGLADFVPTDLQELTDFLAQLKQISDLGLSDGAIQLHDTVMQLDRLWKVLEQLESSSAAVVQGFANLVRAESQAWQSWLDSITGRQRSNAEILEDKKRELAMYKIESELRKASIKQRMLEIQAIIAQLKAGTLLIGGGSGPVGGPNRTAGGGGFVGVTTAMVGLAQAASVTAASIGLATTTISQAALDMIAALEQELAALQDLLAAIPEAPDASEITLGGGGRGGGTGGSGSDRSNVLDFIRDRRFDLDTRGLTDYKRSLAELDRQYAQLIEQAGRDQKLRAEVIALKEREIALLKQEQIRTVVSNFREFLNLVNPFDRVRQTAEELIESIRDSPFGDERKARMIGRVMDELERQLSEIAQEMAVGLFGNLLQDLERFGATAEQQAEIRKQMAILEHTLKMEHYRAEIALLKAEGRLAPEVIAALEAAFEFLRGIDPTKPSVPPAPDDPYKTPGQLARERAADVAADNARLLADILSKARDALRRYQEVGLDPLTRNLQRIVGDFRMIRGALGDTAEVMSAYARAVQNAIDEFLQPIRDVQRDLFYGDQTVADTLTQWEQIQADFAQAQARFRSGDLSGVDEIPDLVQQLLAIAQQVTPTGSQGYTDIFTAANQFLNEVLQLSPDTIGSITNPTHVAGMDSLQLLSQAQLESLNDIYYASLGVQAAIDRLNARAQAGALNGVG